MPPQRYSIEDETDQAMAAPGAVAVLHVDLEIVEPAEIVDNVVEERGPALEHLDVSFQMADVGSGVTLGVVDVVHKL